MGHEVDKARQQPVTGPSGNMLYDEYARRYDLSERELRLQRANSTWQGFEVNRTTNYGREITIRTSKFDPVAIYGAFAVWFVLMMCMWSGRIIPYDPPGGSIDNGQGWAVPAMFVVTLLYWIVGTTVITTLPDEWRRSFTLETCEIRPDGITINRRHFFPRDRVFNWSVDASKEVTGKYCFQLTIIDGTKKLVLLQGMDSVMASVFESSLVDAIRDVWGVKAKMQTPNQPRR